MSPVMDASSYYLGLPPLTAEAKRIHALNAEISPLLRLPPEIRSRIYQEVLGGHTIHIQIPPLKHRTMTPRFYICQRETPERVFVRTAASKINSSDRVAVNVEAFYDRHLRCKAQEPSPYAFVTNMVSFDILSSCRQIYNEAAMAPFESNDFLFEELLHIPWFLKRVNERQSQAVRNIILVQGNFSMHSTDAWTSVLCWLKFLPLNSLTLVFELISSVATKLLPSITRNGDMFIRQLSLLDHNARQTIVCTYMVQLLNHQPFFTIENLPSIERLNHQLNGRLPRSRPSSQEISSASTVIQPRPGLKDPRTYHRKKTSISYRKHSGQPDGD